MKRLTIEVAGRKTANKRFLSAAAGELQGEFLSFPDLELLHKVLTPKRVRILQKLQQIGPIGLRALARALDVDAGNLQRDLKQLKDFGLVGEADEGLFVPYDEIRLELVIKRVA
jgi:predicted transcriptional regulator